MSMQTTTEVKNSKLGEFVQSGRLSRDTTIAEAARLSGLDVSYWRKLEAGQYAMPSPLALQRIAQIIDAPLEDLYALAGYEPIKGLPTFGPYLRAKYNLPPDQVRQLEAYFAFLRSHYGIPEGEKVFPPKQPVKHRVPKRPPQGTSS